MSLIDIHSHILPGIDDGAAYLKDSLSLAKIYVQAGYRQVVATPHMIVDALPSDHYAEFIRELTARLNEYLKEQSVPLEVLTGMEVGLDPRLPQMAVKGELLTLAESQYLLVETPFHQFPLNWWEIIFALASRGITTIFAHPERCTQLAEKPLLLEQMAQAGAKFQVNWDSFIGAYGRQAALVVRRMARNGLIHCLATDSHDLLNRNANSVKGIGSELMERIGEKNFKLIAIHNPARVVEGEELFDMDVDEIHWPVRRKRFWGLMKRMVK